MTVGKQMWQAADDPSAVHAVIWWESMEQWKAIPQNELEQVAAAMGGPGTVGYVSRVRGGKRLLRTAAACSTSSTGSRPPTFRSTRLMPTDVGPMREASRTRMDLIWSHATSDARLGRSTAD